MKEYWESKGITSLIPHLRADGNDWQAPLSEDMFPGKDHLLHTEQLASHQ